ncbi:prepilin peptidase [Actinokineospora inagensis]|uniref:prepilin peptidase n=1 Tax=Actinokineospora inagensis TaxID=103730 RepID=UPI00047914FC|nr:prepilin peptidase [Actinokineospora inagensis]
MANWIFIGSWALIGAVLAVPAAALVRLLDHAETTALRGHWKQVIWSTATFTLLATRLGSSSALLIYSALAAFVVPLIFVDLRNHRLPTKPILVAAITTTVMLVVIAVVGSQLSGLLHALAAAAISLVLLTAIYLIAPGFVGGGDIRLATLLVLGLGWTSWAAAARGIFLGLIISSVYGMCCLLLRKVDRRGHIALGPALAIGALGSILMA